MSISATEGVSGQYGSPTTSASRGVSYTATASEGAQKTTSDKDLFLSLLVAQMRYQDPMNPADSSAFLTQTATFTQVEKLQDVADSSAALLSAQNAFGASGLVGRDVAFIDATTGLETSGAVKGVSFGTDGPVLDVNGVEVPLSSVLKVTASGALA